MATPQFDRVLESEVSLKIVFQFSNQDFQLLFTMITYCKSIRLRKVLKSYRIPFRTLTGLNCWVNTKLLLPILVLFEVIAERRTISESKAQNRKALGTKAHPFQLQ